jgi:murein DD-endopeptidase MepM/ murein hydrolase activator NlpD
MVRSVFGRSPGALVLSLVTAVAASPQARAATDAQPDGAITVSHRARAIQPGELVVIQAVVAAPATRVTGRAFERSFDLYPAGAPNAWHGLVGIDLDVEPGTVPVMVQAVAPDGSTSRQRHDLVVESKQFPTRRLTVSEEFVNPPANEIERIQREARQVATIFGRASGARRWSGPFARPVPGDATSSFGKRSILNGQPRSPHSGTDFQGATGTPVQAPNAGRIVLAANLYFSGNVVIVDHGQGLYSYFAHLSRLGVAEGDEVETGDLLGQVGATGRVTGPHLHWTVRVNGARVDALSLLSVLSDETS